MNVPAHHKLSSFHAVCLYQESWMMENHVQHNETDLFETSSLLGGSALHFCALNKDPDIGTGIKYLVKSGLSPLVQDKDGATPLHWAARWGTVEALVALASHISPEIPLDHFGRDPVHWFFSAGQDRYSADLKLTFLCTQLACSLNSRDHHLEATPLHWAAALGGPVGILLQSTPKLVNERDRDGATPLHYLAGAVSFLEQNLVALLRAGADLEARTHDQHTIEQIIGGNRELSEHWDSIIRNYDGDLSANMGPGL